MADNTDASTSSVSDTVWAALALALIFLAITVEFLSFHVYKLLLPESLTLMFTAAAIGTALGLISSLRPQTLRPLLIAFALTLFISRPSLFSFFVASFGGEVTTKNDIINTAPFTLKIYYLILIVTSGGLCWLIRKHLATIASLTFGTIVFALFVIPSSSEDSVSRTENYFHTIKHARDLNPLPPLIHIILDEQIGIAGLQADVPGGRQAVQLMRDTYRDFELYERGFSRFRGTRASIASLMNGELGTDIEFLSSKNGRSNSLIANKWFDELKSKGYTIKTYQAEWLNLCVNQTLEMSCYTYPVGAVNAIQRSSLTVGQRLRALAAKIFSDKNFQIFEHIQLSPLSATEAFQQFRADINKGQLGVAYVVHLLLPHSGYIYSADCSLLPPDKWRGQYTAKGEKGLVRENAKKLRIFNYQSYIEQMTCTNRLISSLFRQLKNLQIYDDATIIIHGDHGSRITGLSLDITSGIELSNQDLLDSYSTLIAIKLPGIAPRLNSTPISIQQLFARRFLNLPSQDNNLTPSTVMFTNSDGIVSEHTIHWPNQNARQ